MPAHVWCVGYSVPSPPVFSWISYISMNSTHEITMSCSRYYTDFYSSHGALFRWRRGGEGNSALSAVASDRQRLRSKPSPPPFSSSPAPADRRATTRRRLYILVVYTAAPADRRATTRRRWWTTGGPSRATRPTPPPTTTAVSLGGQGSAEPS